MADFFPQELKQDVEQSVNKASGVGAGTVHHAPPRHDPLKKGNRIPRPGNLAPNLTGIQTAVVVRSADPYLFPRLFSHWINPVLLGQGLHLFPRQSVETHLRHVLGHPRPQSIHCLESGKQKQEFFKVIRSQATVHTDQGMCHRMGDLFPAQKGG